MVTPKNLQVKHPTNWSCARPPLKLPDGWSFVGDQNEYQGNHQGYPMLDRNNPDTVNMWAGDYTVRGPDGYCYEKSCSVERKTGINWIMDVGTGRDRFKRSLAKMSAMAWPAVVIEEDWDKLAKPYLQKRGGGKTSFGRTHPNSVIGSLISWSQKYRMPIYTASNRIEAERVTRWILAMFAHAVEKGELAIDREAAEMLGSKDENIPRNH